MLRLLLCILGLFLPPNFTLSFHYQSSEVTSVRIQSEDKLKIFFISFLVGIKRTPLTFYISWFIKPVAERKL